MVALTPSRRWQVAYNVCMFLGCFYVVHFRMMPKIMAGDHVGESSRAEEGGNSRAEEGGSRRAEEGDVAGDALSIAMASSEGVAPPQIGMRLENGRPSLQAAAAGAEAGAQRDVVRPAWDP
jgi:hypothetical protein